LLVLGISIPSYHLDNSIIAHLSGKEKYFLRSFQLFFTHTAYIGWKGVINVDPYDSEIAARVWQRVHPEGGETLTGDCLNALIAQFLHLSTVYQTLSRQVKPPQSTTLKVLSDQKRTQAACLRGLHILSVGPCPTLRVPQARAEPLSTALRRCYSAEIQLWTQLRIHSAVSAHTPTLEALATTQQTHCRALAELIGQLEG
jgi:hypothetical protein